MTKILYISGLSLLMAGVLWSSWCQPELLNDDNAFLEGFIGYELLNILGFILAITLASTAQIHLRFNEMEERVGKEFLTKSRLEVKSNALWLIHLFVLATILIAIKPYWLAYPRIVAFVNGVALWIFLFYIFILLDVVMSIFKLSPIFKSDPNLPTRQRRVRRRTK